MGVKMEQSLRWLPLGSAHWRRLLTVGVAVCLLSAIACGSETDDAAEPATEQSGATTATTDTASSAGSDAAPVADVPEPEVAVGHEVGMKAPDFTVGTVAGESFNLSDVNAAGSPVLLYFFATW